MHERGEGHESGLGVWGLALSMKGKHLKVSSRDVTCCHLCFQKHIEPGQTVCGRGGDSGSN